MKKLKLVFLMLLWACLAFVFVRTPEVRFAPLSNTFPVPFPTLTFTDLSKTTFHCPANYPQYDGVSGLLERGCDSGGETYQQLPPNRQRDAEFETTTTFSVDVDTASYSNIRRYLTSGHLPPSEAVRVEEMLNYFRYSYPPAPSGRPFSVSTALGACPWDPGKRLLRIGLQGKDLTFVPAKNLVLLIDVSGSMSDPDKLPLLKESLYEWVGELGPRDTLSIVTYAGNSATVLAPTSGDRQSRIRAAVSVLDSGGGTDGASGILTAYDLARQNFEKGAVNRVILATDGDFNFGLTEHDDLIKLIEVERASGIYLSVLGLGEGNIDDYLMEQLADHGNGNYAYLDSAREAHRVLSCQADSTFLPVADDVKVQVEFDPLVVGSYRQVGYENRALSNQDFRDDRKDAGDLGASQQVTALYEVELKKSNRSLGEVRLRYRLPGEPESLEWSHDLAPTAPDHEDFPFQCAVAEMGLALQGDERATLKRSLGSQSDLRLEAYPWRQEFRHLLKAAYRLGPDGTTVREARTGQV